MKWLYAHVPSYSEWNRFWIFWRMGDGGLPNFRVDPDWQSGGESVSAVNDFVRLVLIEYLKAEFGDRPDLLEKVIPNYPPGAKRMLRDNGIWARTLKRDNVRLITDDIREITPKGIVTADGEEHQVDVLIYGTGFHASKFLTPMKVTGRNGIDLHEQWGGDARAYLGVAIPHFPNFFCLYGPNTNIVVNGSIIYFSECGVRYILGLLELLFESEHAHHRGAQGRARHVQRSRRRREQGDGVGLVRREQLVQERARPRRAELAVHAPRVLAAHAAPQPRRLRPLQLTPSSPTVCAPARR